MMTAGQRLYPDTEIRANGAALRYQGDGNLVLYGRTGPRLATDTDGHAAGYVEMQADGNLVAYDAAGTPYWATNTRAEAPALHISPAGLRIIGSVTAWAIALPEEPAPARPALSRVRLLGRAIGDDAGAALHVGLSRFYHVWAMKHDPDRVAREDDQDAAAGFRFKRVLLQVGSLDPSDYWAGRVADQTWPDHQELVARMCQGARERGLRIAAAIIGKGNGMDRQSNRRPYVRRMAEVLREYQDVVLVAQVMNEPYAWGYITPSEALELEAIIREVAPGLLTSTGAHGLDADCGGFDRRAWGQVGTPHLDRDTTKSEMQDRPWRQPWDWGLQGAPVISDEPIGPGASVAVESRPRVLRSHATVSFVSRFAGYCFHADPGIRGFGDLSTVPGYAECPAATRFLPGDLANGEAVNANANFAQRHWQLDDEFLRSATGNRRGIVRAYGVQHGGLQYTVPFGPVSDFELRAMVGMRVQCYQQDVNDRLWERDVQPGERVRFSAEHHDYLLISRAL